MVKLSEVPHYLYEFHTSVERGTHTGRQSTVNKINLNYYLPNVNKLVSDYIRNCAMCHQAAPLKQKPIPVPIETFQPMERLTFDFKKMFCDPVTGYEWLLFMIDHYSSFVWMAGFKTKEAGPVALWINETLATEGYPKFLQSDNGREFKNQVTISTIFQVVLLTNNI